MARFTLNQSHWHCSRDVEFVGPGRGTRNSEITSGQHFHTLTAGAGP